MMMGVERKGREMSKDLDKAGSNDEEGRRDKVMGEGKRKFRIKRKRWTRSS